MPYSLKKSLATTCEKSTTVKLYCGHSTRVDCSTLPAVVANPPPCMSTVEIHRSCGHRVERPCYRSSELLAPCTDPVDDTFSFPCGLHSIRPRHCSHLTELRSRKDPRCPVEVRCVLPRCGHNVNIECHLVNKVSQRLAGETLDLTKSPRVVHADVPYAENPVEAPKCCEPVIYRSACGHDVPDVPCHLAFDWTAMRNAPPCEQSIRVPSPL